MVDEYERSGKECNEANEEYNNESQRKDHDWNNQIRRRKLLGGITGASVSAAVFPGLVSATLANDEQLDDVERDVKNVIDLSGKKKNEVVKRTKSKAKVSAIHEYLIDSGFDKDSTSVYRSISPDGHFNTVSFQYTDENEKAGLV